MWFRNILGLLCMVNVPYMQMNDPYNSFWSFGIRLRLIVTTFQWSKYDGLSFSNDWNETSRRAQFPIMSSATTRCYNVLAVILQKEGNATSRIHKHARISIEVWNQKNPSKRLFKKRINELFDNMYGNETRQFLKLRTFCEGPSW